MLTGKQVNDPNFTYMRKYLLVLNPTLTNGNRCKNIAIGQRGKKFYIIDPYTKQNYTPLGCGLTLKQAVARIDEDPRVMDLV